MQIRPLFSLIPFIVLFVGCATDGADPVDPALSIDSDGDGLTDAEEADLGTDPASADSDRDSFGDAVEVELGTNPLYRFSRPYEGGYHVGFCADRPQDAGASGKNFVELDDQEYVWTVYQPGDVMDNHRMLDQHGENVALYSFCGKTTMLVLSKGSCGACSKLSDDLQALQDDWAGEGVQIIEVLAGTVDHQAPTVDDVQLYADKHGLIDIPVLALPAEAWDDDQSLFWQLEKDLAFPSVAWIGPDMQLLAVDTLDVDPADYVE